jgi:hypothetical protein
MKHAFLSEQIFFIECPHGPIFQTALIRHCFMIRAVLVVIAEKWQQYKCPSLGYCLSVTFIKCNLVQLWREIQSGFN